MTAYVSSICTRFILHEIYTTFQSYVFSFTTGEDLCTSSYFTGAVPIVRTTSRLHVLIAQPPLKIETQIAKQGYRLAAWLNVLFDGATNLP